MINTTSEFIKLRNSDIPAEYNRTGIEEAPIDVWMELIENHPDMKVWVARNKSIPMEIINILSLDNDPVIRDAISSKYPLDIEIYQLFSKDADEGIRAKLTYNKGLPLFILKDMAKNDPSEFVRTEAKSRYDKRMK